tara:strand:+ start:383 stop:982 length:600 start_codon:yes stop_codon:yes gene_type:complete
MAEYEMAFILTDSSQRYFDPDDKEAVEVVKQSNTKDLSEYSPFGLWYGVGHLSPRSGFKPTRISGDSQNITIEGYIKRGILPISITETFQIGDTYSADGMFSVSSDGASRSQGSVTITQIVLAKNKDDVEGILNAMQKLNTEYGRKISSAEESEEDGVVPEAIMWKAENDEFTLEDYESYMAEMGMASYPQERFFSSNV